MLNCIELIKWKYISESYQHFLDFFFHSNGINIQKNEITSCIKDISNSISCLTHIIGYAFHLSLTYILVVGMAITHLSVPL